MTSRLPPPRSKHSAEAGLGEAVDHLDLDACLTLDAVDELVAVGGEADRAGRAGDDLGDAGGVGEHAHRAHGAHGEVGGGGRDPTPAAHVVTEAQHLLLAGERGEAPVGMDVGDEQVEGIRAEVERRDAHRGRL
jgi:hypothetical protein